MNVRVILSRFLVALRFVLCFLLFGWETTSASSLPFAHIVGLDSAWRLEANKGKDTNALLKEYLVNKNKEWENLVNEAEALWNQLESCTIDQVFNLLQGCDHPYFPYIVITMGDREASIKELPPSQCFALVLCKLRWISRTQANSTQENQDLITGWLETIPDEIRGFLPNCQEKDLRNLLAAFSHDEKTNRQVLTYWWKDAFLKNEEGAVFGDEGSNFLIEVSLLSKDDLIPPFKVLDIVSEQRKRQKGNFEEEIWPDLYNLPPRVWGMIFYWSDNLYKREQSNTKVLTGAVAYGDPVFLQRVVDKNWPGPTHWAEKLDDAYQKHKIPEVRTQLSDHPVLARSCSCCNTIQNRSTSGVSLSKCLTHRWTGAQCVEDYAQQQLGTMDKDIPRLFEFAADFNCIDFINRRDLSNINSLRNGNEILSMFFHTLSLSLRHGMRTIFDQSLTALIASVPNVARIFLKKAVEEKDFPVFIQILTRQEDILSNNGQDLRSILNGMIGIIFSDKLDQSPKSKGIKACIERQISKRITQHFFKFLKINEKFFLNLPLPLGAKLTIQQALLATVKSAEYAANNVTSHIVKMLSDEDIRFFEWQIAQKEEFLEWVHNEAYQKEEKERRVIVDAKCLGWREVVNIIWAKWGQEIIRNKYLREKTLSSIISGNRYLFDFIAHNYSGFYKWLYDDEQFLIYVCANFEEKKIKLHEIFEVIAKDLVKDQNILPTICNLIENCQVELLQQICMAGINCIKWKDTRNQGVLNWLCDRANQNRFWDAREKLKLLFNCFKKEIEQDEEVIKELRKYKKSQSNVKQLLLECKINLP